MSPASHRPLVVFDPLVGRGTGGKARDLGWKGFRQRDLDTEGSIIESVYSILSV